MNILQNLLCIDYGKKHCGLAFASTPLAEPLETVLTQEIFEKLPTIIDQQQIKAIVLGLSESYMAQLTKEFAQELSKKTQLPIYFHDETLSSYETRKKTAQAGMKKSRRHSKMDHLVAATILQEFLDSYNSLEDVPEADRIIFIAK